MRKLHIILALAFGPALIALAYGLFSHVDTTAFNTNVNEYRKWPWRAGASHTITTRPNDWPHAGTWCQHDIDVECLDVLP